MLITILTAGSRGDTQPYIALGLELKKAGHTVRIAASEGFESFITGYGLEVFALKGNITELARTAVGQEAMKADNPLKFFSSFNSPEFKAFALEMQNGFYNACAGSDLIVYHPGAPIGYFIASQMQIPSVLAPPFPMTPTREYPALLFYDSVRLGRGYNLLTHRLFESMFWLAVGGSIKGYWIQKFGHAPDHFSNPFKLQTTRRLPTVTACSDYVFPRPADWPEHVHNTGFWFLDDMGGWAAPAELLDFLQKGKPPVYVGFGSLGNSETAVQTTELVMEALRLSGQRGVLATGWNGMASLEHGREDVFILESAPHSWLFPQMAAVVHHGGAGTTAAGLRAGVPSVIVPFANDQFAWGRRVFELGVGPRAIRRKNLSAQNLAQAIQSALKPAIADAARELGRKIQSETGAATAARIILQTV